MSLTIFLVLLVVALTTGAEAQGDELNDGTGMFNKRRGFAFVVWLIAISTHDSVLLQ